MSDSVKQRLIGAIVLLIVAACLWPVIFKPVENPDVVLRSKIPAAPELQVFEIPRQQAPSKMPDVAAEIESQRPAMGDVKKSELIGEENISRVDEPALADTLDLTSADNSLDTSDPIGDIATSDEVAKVQVPATAELAEDANEPKKTTQESNAVGVIKSNTVATKPETQSESDAYGINDATTPATSASADSPMWALQAGAFGDASNAERLADELRAKNFTVVVQRRFGATRMLAFVMVGPYFNVDNARVGIVDLQKAGYKSTLVEFAP